MIRANALRHMLALECAAADWFARLGHEEQDAYRRAHPGSKYAHGATAPAPTDHAGHVRHHDDMTRFHARRANARGEDIDAPGYGSDAHAATLHAMAASRHMRAMNDPTSGGERTAARRASTEANIRTRRVLHPVPGKD